jgi:hypothetical protein
MVKRSRVSKYQPLDNHLAARSETIYNIGFGVIEEILSAPLPPSARKHPAWWSNEINGRHVNARAWMNTGFRTENLNFEASTVTFKYIGR